MQVHVPHCPAQYHAWSELSLFDEKAVAIATKINTQIPKNILIALYPIITVEKSNKAL